MNDLVLVALLNLFALFGTISRINREKAQGMINNYLVRYFGILKYEEYIDLYNNLRDVYEMTPQLDTDKILSVVFSRLQEKIPKEEQALLILRFMEFSSNNKEAYRQNINLFREAAIKFGVSEVLFDDFQHFIEHRANENVVVGKREDIDGELCVLQLKQFNRTILTYEGGSRIYMNEIPILNNIFVLWPQNGIIKGKQSAPIYYDWVNKLFGNDKRADHIFVSGRDIDFRFPNSDNGLHKFTFDLQSGQLVAIMGGSGVGKSTLLSILNGTLRPQSGELFFNGLSLYDNLSRLRDLIGYVPQDDLLIAELTVYQNLYYTARFSFDSISEEEVAKRVNYILAELDLAYIKDLKVGSALNKTISGGQRKRLNIALELIREPAVLFLDEPTSGLSSADSEKVVHLLKEQTFKGKLVIVNIHQPSSDIYKLFDRLWLLDKGGYPIYDGNPIEAVTYFKNAADYADAETAVCQTCGNIYPEAILNIVDAKALNNSGQLMDKRKITPQEWHEKYRESIVDTEIPVVTDIPKTGQKKPNAFKQFVIYLERNIKTKISDRQFLAITLLEAPLLAAIVAVLTRYSGDDGYCLFDNKNLISYMFMAIIVAIFMGMSITAEDIYKDRALLKREKFLQLSYFSYISSKIALSVVVSLVQTLLFIIVGNNIIGIHDLFGVWWIILFTCAFLSNLTGLFLSQSLNSIVSIYITIPLLLIPQILLCGLVVPFSDLNQHAKNNYVPLIGEVVPSRWAFEALAVTSFTDNTYNQKFFSYESGQYELQFYRIGYIDQMESSLETAYWKKKRNEVDFYKELPMLQNEVEKLAEKWSLSPYLDIQKVTAASFNEKVYKSLTEWLKYADKELYRKSLVYTRLLDKEKQNYINAHGVDALIKEQKDYCNKKLEETLQNFGTKNLCEIEEDVLVPKVGAIYLDPDNTMGRAAFYSNNKIVGYAHIPTLWFNLIILWIMCAGVAVALYLDVPGKYIRNK